MADYDKNLPYATVPQVMSNNTINQWGNALTWNSESDVNFLSNADENTFYDYVFTLSSVQNPSYGGERMAEGDMSYDYTYPDSTPRDLSDNLWTRYEQYSTKFCLAVWDDAQNTNTDTEAF